MALEIFRLVGSVFVDTDKADKSMQKTDKNAAGLGKRFLSGVASAAKFGAAVVSMATAAGTAMVALAEKTREYRTEQGKLTTAFQSGGFAAEDARKTYAALNGVLGDSGQAIEAASHLAELCDTTEQLTDWETILIGVNGKWGASLPVENLAEAANMAAKNCEVSSGLADALDWAGVSSEAFKEKLEACNSEQERQALITSTLTELYADEAKTFRETNAEVIAANTATDKLNATMAKIGGIIEPLITQGKVLIADVLLQMMPFVTQFAETILPILIGLLSQLGTSLLPPLLMLVQQLLPPIMKVVQMLLPGLVELIQTFVPPLLEIVSVLLPPLLGLLQPVLDLLAPILALLQPVLDLVVGILGPLAELITGLLTPMITIVSRLIEVALIPLQASFTVLSGLLSGTVTYALDSIMNGVNAAKGVFSGLIQFVTGVFTGSWSKAWEGVKKIFSSIWDGIKGAVKIPINAIIDGINSFIRGINKIKIPNWVPLVGGKGFSIAEIPRLESGAVLEKGQVGLLEGNGAEAVVPLHNNKKWIRAVAQDMSQNGLDGSSSNEMLEAFLTFTEVLPDVLADAFAGMQFKVNNREFGRLVKAVE